MISSDDAVAITPIISTQPSVISVAINPNSVRVKMTRGAWYISNKLRTFRGFTGVAPWLNEFSLFQL